MGTTTVAAKLRSTTGKGAARALRREGFVPAICYGAGKAPTSLSLAPKEIVRVLHSEAGPNTLIDLQIEGEAAPRQVMIKSVALEPVKRTIKHVDLYEVTADKAVVVKVPLVFDSLLAVTKAGNQIRVLEREIKIRCLPSQIPTAVHLDATTIKPGTNFVIRQLELPEGIEAVYKHNFAIAHVKGIVVEEAAPVVEAPKPAAKKK